MEIKTCISPTCTLYAVPGKKYCRSCASRDRQEPAVVTEDNPYNFKSQIELFKYCWETKPRHCFVTGQKLDKFEGGALFLSIFAHVLRKSAYFEIRLSPNNIVLLSPNFNSYSIHRLYDDGVISEIKKVEKIYGKSFKSLFEFERSCQTRYNQEHNKKTGERRITTEYLKKSSHLEIS